MQIVYLLLVLFGVIGLQTFLFNRIACKNLEYNCKFSVSEAHEGDDILFIETVYNRKLLPVPWIKAHIHSSRWLEFAETESVVVQENRRVLSCFLLKGFQRTTRRWKLKCLKRGIFTTENVTLEWGDVLGIATNSAPVRVDAGITVYPEIIDLDEIYMPASYLQGDTIVKRWVIDDPFVILGTREYTPWDPMNRIFWKATAKEGKLMVRNNDYTSQFSLTVILNIQSIEREFKNVVHSSRIELGIKTAATLFDRALRMCMPVRFATNGITVDDRDHTIFTEEAAGREHVNALLKILAKLELQNRKDFDGFIEDIRYDICNSEVVVITSYLNESICSVIQGMSARNNQVKIILLDRLAEYEDLPGDTDIYFLRGDDADE